MDRKKLIYIGLVLIVTVIASVTYFSYAFFTNTSEQHGKLNVVVGTLNYKIECFDLTNNAITLAAGEKKEIEIKITSLNDINSKYELYYITDNNDIQIGYSTATVDQPSGSINSNQSKMITIVIKNNTSSSATITFGIEGGFSSKILTLTEGNSISSQLNICDYNSGYTWNFPFDPDGDGKGQIQTFSPPCTGNYKLEVWGAAGDSTVENYGYGGYAVGVYNVSSDLTMYVVVGQKAQKTVGGYNGGGTAGGVVYGGGGATHIALDSGLLSSLSSHATDGRILIVAGGGGGAWNYSGLGAGSGGGYLGTDGYGNGNSYGSGGSQTAGGSSSYPGSFGKGGEWVGNQVGGGGGGYYGGGCGYRGGSSSGAGGGGSGYIASSNLISTTNVTKHMACYNCTGSYLSTVASTKTITALGVNQDPVSDYAKKGHGHARITYLGE